MRKYHRDRKGRFDRNYEFYRKLLIAIFVSSMFGASMTGIKNIEKVLEKTFQVDNVQAEVTITTPTWQEEVKMMIRDAGLDVELATRLVQHESWWDYQNNHWNTAIYRNGKLVQPAHWDRGLWMISEYWHPEVSDECAFDWFCSTREAIRIWKNRGPQEWVAYQYVK